MVQKRSVCRGGVHVCQCQKRVLDLMEAGVAAL